MLGFIKTVVLSVLIVAALQIQVQGQSIEAHLLTWSHSMGVTQFVNNASRGAVQLAQDVSQQALNSYRRLTQPSKAGQKASY